MSLEVTIDLPQYPKGHPLSITGLGMCENGKSMKVSEEQEQAFVSQNGKSVREALKGMAGIKVSGETTAKPDEEGGK